MLEGRGNMYTVQKKTIIITIIIINKYMKINEKIL
jgi:hypothetical protein